MSDRRHRLGMAGEEIAAEYLVRHGYTVLARNVRVPGGEIDIVAQDGQCLAFVEVRTRRGGGFGGPEESITAAKAQRLVRLVDAFRDAHADEALPLDSRIDFVAVELDTCGAVVRIELIKSAVEG